MPTAALPIDTPHPARIRHFILGTAGHIDHGKTSLVRALTGTDPDRLPEEKRRGMTIELGFAELRVGDVQFGVVDVPGHERFVRTMVAGATGVDVALLVVAADDSVMPQTLEHVDILRLLGIDRGVIALTKIDAVDPDLVEMAALDVRELVRDSPLVGAPLCPVSALTGAGLPELTEALLHAVDGVDPASPRPPFRMAIDRVFTVQGRGTVVTGSVLRGAVHVGDSLELLPCGDLCRVRGLQSHGTTSDAMVRGQRAALNLGGIERDRVERGCELATPGFLQSTFMVDVRVQCLPSSRLPLKTGSTLRLGMGTGERPVRVALYEDDRLEPGQAGYAQLRCGEALVAAYGQRFILRDASALRTVGGGVVLAPASGSRRHHAQDQRKSLVRLDRGGKADRLEEVLRASRFGRPADLRLCSCAGIEMDELPALLAELRQRGRWLPIAGTGVCAVPESVDEVVVRITRWMERFHQAHPDQPGQKLDTLLGRLERLVGPPLARPLLDRLLTDGAVHRLGEFVCLPAFAPRLSAAEEKLLQNLTAELLAGGFQPPTVDALRSAANVDRKRLDRVLTLAVATGVLVPIEPKMFLHAHAEGRLRGMVQSLIERQGAVTVAQVREALGSSRKYVVPFLEYLDRIGFTRRTDDVRTLAGGAQAPERPT